MAFDRSAYAEGVRASLPVLLGIVPFGAITGVAMVASGIPPLAAVAMSVFVFAGASIWAPELLLQNQVLYLALENERLLAGLVAIAAAWRWRLTSVTIAAGLAALHFFDWLI